MSRLPSGRQDLPDPNQMGGDAGTEAVVYVYHTDICGTGIKHCQERGKAA